MTEQTSIFTQQLAQQLNLASTAIKQCHSIADLEQTKPIFLGKQGSITELMKTIASLSIEEKKQQGAAIQQLKKAIEDLINQQKQYLQQLALNEKLNRETIDVSLPSRHYAQGSVHPVMHTWYEIETIFHSLGFNVAKGPEIENDWFNFTSLNSPQNHPARSMQDTFYVDIEDAYQNENKNAHTNKNHCLLRTHTSPIQVRYASNHVKHCQDLSQMPDIRIIAPGRTYRVDSDATHSPMFHQVEGLWIGKDVNFSDLKGLYTYFLRAFFQNDAINVRFRPSYFPFTEPSAEVDMSFGEKNGQTKWLEISGAGQVHPKVLQNMGIDSETYIGFAFGSGLERLTMLKYGIEDLRLFFDGDLRFLKQFKVI